jgi:hypothetical protein
VYQIGTLAQPTLSAMTGHSKRLPELPKNARKQLKSRLHFDEAGE